MPWAVITCTRSLTAAPAFKGTPARAARRSARRCTTALAADADARKPIGCSRSSGASAFSTTITRAAGATPAAGAAVSVRPGRATDTSNKAAAADRAKLMAAAVSAAFQRAITRTISSTLQE